MRVEHPAGDALTDAEFEPGMDRASFTGQADSALYDAKARGRNRSSTAIGEIPVTSAFIH